MSLRVLWPTLSTKGKAVTKMADQALRPGPAKYGWKHRTVSGNPMLKVDPLMAT